jgi:multiple sugar transport system ATP-binding protein
MASVHLRGIAKSYGRGQQIIQSIDLDIPAGQFTVLVGPSGCGKSTLLRMIAGLEDISAGELIIGERLCNHVPPAQRGVAMVFQNYALYPHMSVADNMGFALRLAGMDKDALLDRKPAALSGGQRQRVALGRAIVREPEVFLFDEPLSNLDAALRVQMRIELARLHGALASTMIYVTHDQVEAMTLGEQVVVLNSGRIEQAGPPLQLYEHPVNRFVAGFLGAPRMNFLPANVQSADSAGVTVLLAGGTQLAVSASGAGLVSGQPVTVGIRPEHIRLAAGGPGNTVPATMVLVEHLGESMIAHAQVQGVAETVALRLDTEQHRPSRGDPVLLSMPAARTLLFGADGQALVRLS